MSDDGPHYEPRDESYYECGQCGGGHLDPKARALCCYDDTCTTCHGSVVNCYEGFPCACQIAAGIAEA